MNWTGFLCCPEPDIVLLKHFLDVPQLELDNRPDLIFGERFEHDDLIDPVEEFGTDGLFKQFEHLLPGAFDIPRPGFCR